MVNLCKGTLNCVPLPRHGSMITQSFCRTTHRLPLRPLTLETALRASHIAFTVEAPPSSSSSIQCGGTSEYKHDLQLSTIVSTAMAPFLRRT